MKIKKFNENNTSTFFYYEIVDIYADIVINGNSNEYEQNFDAQDIKDTVRYLLELRNTTEHNDKYHIRKVTYQKINNEIINKLKKEIELENDSDKFNL